MKNMVNFNRALVEVDSYILYVAALVVSESLFLVHKAYESLIYELLIVNL